MKTLIFYMLLGLPLALSAFGEKVEVYQCEVKFAEVEWGEAGNRKDTSKFQVWRMTKKVGTIETECLFDVAKAAWNYEHSKESSDDPFFGEGDNYILKDSKGRFYVVFFECDKGSKAYDSIRFAINGVSQLDPMIPVFPGTPHEGTSFDKDLIEDLKKLTKTIAEQAVPPNEP
jgi:hypothetical protein